MKRFNSAAVVVLMFFTITFFGCKKEWLDINTNPNQLPTASPTNTFTAGVNRAVSFLDPYELGAFWSAQFTQSSTYIISSTYFSYIFNNTNFNFWDTWYDILEDFQYSIDNADTKEQPYMKGPARVMKALIYQQIVDVYGNVPYTDALKGLNSLAPKFDDQKAIYEDLIKSLDTAVADLKANPFLAAGVSADKVFGGSTANWVRFANSLKMRILLRQSKISGRSAYITAEINKAAATTEGFITADVATNPGFLATTGKTNPFYDRWGYDPTGTVRPLNRYHRPTTFLFNLLKNTNDTFRLKRLFYAVGGESSSSPGVSTRAEVVSNYVAVPYGASSGYLSQNTSATGPAQIVRNQFAKPVIIMNAAESYFLLAEAKQLYGTAVNLPLTAKEYYEAGVKASFQTTGTDVSRATALLTSGIALADWEASPDKLKAIWNQKYISLVLYNGLEAWSEYRRTNYPEIPMPAAAATNAKRPLRLYYPQTEETSNGANVKAQGVVDPFSTRIFWDVD